MKVLFLCTGNSCRSQMAEGFSRHVTDGRWEARSAGIEAHGLNPHAVAAMTEIGIDISKQSSKILDADLLNGVDLVITVCDEARKQCPVVPSAIRQLHWSFADPARATGSPQAVAAVFRTVRDQIGAHVRELVRSEGL